MSKQSSVDFLYESLKSKFPNVYAIIRYEMDKHYEKAKEMEREQIENSWKECMSMSAKEYYEKTYGGQDE